MVGLIATEATIFAALFAAYVFVRAGSPSWPQGTIEAPELTKIAVRRIDKAQITVNKNSIPFDTQSPFVTSGIRLGTPAITTRGLKEAECQQIAQLIDAALSHPNDESELKRIRFQVNGMMRLRPLFS